MAFGPTTITCPAGNSLSVSPRCSVLATLPAMSLMVASPRVSVPAGMLMPSASVSELSTTYLKVKVADAGDPSGGAT